jgi:hypothetical protein
MAEPFEAARIAGSPSAASHESDDDFFPKVHPEFSEPQIGNAKGKHSETPDQVDNSDNHNLTLSQWLRVAKDSCVHVGVEDSLNGISQLINHVEGSTLIPPVYLVDPIQDASLGSSRWYAQTVGAGVCSIPDFVAVDLLTRRIGGSELLMSIRKFHSTVPLLSVILESQRTRRFLAPLTHSAVNGAIYGGLFAPASSDHKDFWKQRGENTFLASLCFTSQYGISHGVMDGIEQIGVGHMHFDGHSRLDTKTFITHAGANVLGGVGAGVIGSEAYSEISTGAPANRELLENSVAKFALTSFGLDLIHSAGVNVSSKVKEHFAKKGS